MAYIFNMPSTAIHYFCMSYKFCLEKLNTFFFVINDCAYIVGEGIDQWYFLIMIPAGMLGNILSFLVCET